jgi:hypothetical protein
MPPASPDPNLRSPSSSPPFLLSLTNMHGYMHTEPKWQRERDADLHASTPSACTGTAPQQSAACPCPMQMDLYSDASLHCSYMEPTDGIFPPFLQVKPGKFSGQGYTIQKPTEDTFKRVISPSSLASPGGANPTNLAPPPPPPPPGPSALPLCPPQPQSGRLHREHPLICEENFMHRTNFASKSTLIIHCRKRRRGRLRRRRFLLAVTLVAPGIQTTKHSPWNPKPSHFTSCIFFKQDMAGSEENRCLVPWRRPAIPRQARCRYCHLFDCAGGQVWCGLEANPRGELYQGVWKSLQRDQQG